MSASVEGVGLSEVIFEAVHVGRRVVLIKPSPSGMRGVMLTDGQFPICAFRIIATSASSRCGNGV